jgi:hypothetical protein
MAGANGNEPLKVLSFGFKEMDRSTFESLLAEYNNDVEAEGFRQ